VVTGDKHCAGLFLGSPLVVLGIYDVIAVMSGDDRVLGDHRGLIVGLLGIASPGLVVDPDYDSCVMGGVTRVMRAEVPVAVVIAVVIVVVVGVASPAVAPIFTPVVAGSCVDAVAPVSEVIACGEVRARGQAVPRQTLGVRRGRRG
jgi:hypothetical protein